MQELKFSCRSHVYKTKCHMQSGTRESSFWKQNKLSISKKKFLAREVAKLVVVLYLQEFEDAARVVVQLQVSGSPL